MVSLRFDVKLHREYNLMRRVLQVYVIPSEMYVTVCYILERYIQSVYNRR